MYCIDIMISVSEGVSFVTKVFIFSGGNYIKFCVRSSEHVYFIIYHIYIAVCNKELWDRHS